MLEGEFLHNAAEWFLLELHHPFLEYLSYALNESPKVVAHLASAARSAHVPATTLLIRIAAAET